MKLGKIRPQDLNDLYEQLSQNGLNKVTCGKLSNKTIVEHHRLVSTILTQSEKELLIPFSLARKASPPKITKQEVDYFQMEDIEKIRGCLHEEPIKWKAATHPRLTVL